ncbi:pyrroline-5-carboxylate reductase [Mycobacteroides chelonae]|jgi:pyrroline-5-carboxylate reductase|uniref:Pyrroline-5-carboxylate reductase n=3 Tax=Mycobacteriaceae TaxID=1762 RepID=A0A0E3XRS9_MYCCH|nr:pyrroline-5-carboxylate reductase [Mycobacteroides chelonae]ANA99983.1 pyrroline-5-carboxylate reductase [Mycobacteroides chelonae CCUG 47445]AYM43646.1 pyrroline-5-carboxylate reductase [[Mycobacterium] chelonae subsp. gwanakae]KRQ18624.1 pyrroline-5-carboxylate reductase [Mycobacteroides sp. H003]KRQ21845.1 pyrroline-5-carboxylate reductase [Mycobacteroides sp. H092]KRQ22007.1 pyrroline-5-carboxylate reductase [Mycobacteroides sp. H072]KRQ30865.1 pyrroline-5-carboxylate reductase [Mycoba
MLVAMSRIAIIGGGNIGEALISGLLRAGRQAKDIVVSEKVPARAKALAEAYSIRVSEVADAVEGADFIVVAVKPSDVESATSEIAAALAKLDAEGSDRETEQVLVSVAAGVSASFFESKLAAGAPVVRVMPNAPMLVGAGVSAVAKGRFATDEQLSAVAELLESVGSVIKVAESQMDTVTALSGSGPAYFFLLVEALVDAGVASGLTRPVATDLVIQTMAGSAAMLLERAETDENRAPGLQTRTEVDTTAAELRATITSPGGTTAAALRELERGGLRASVYAAVEAAKTRSEQLGITSE